MKRLMIALAVGALVLSMAGLASATDVNIFGASAQFNFWSAQAPAYLTSASGADCTGAVTTANYVPSDNTPTGVYYHGAKYFIASASSCNASVVPDGTLTIRVGAYDSCDGIQAILGITNLTDVAGCTGNERAMPSSTSSPTIVSGNCYPITLGAADVDGTSIIESDISTQLDGPKGPVSPTYGYTLPGSTGGTKINLDLGAWNAPAENYTLGWTPVDTTSPSSVFVDYHPFVLPFGFFANKAIKTGDSSNLLAADLTNLTTNMVEEIFSGTATDWSQFGVAPATCTGSNCPITICLRQPGSGTFGLFDNGVQSTNTVGPGLPSFDVTGGTNAWFNNTSGDMMNCINSIPGAIGFADADQGNSADTFGPINFNGFSPTAVSGSTSNPNVVNGLYDRFFSLEHIFEAKANNPSNSHTVIENMVSWSYVQANNPRKNVWVISNTMQWHKSADDVYPYATGGYVEGTEY